ncbi:MAG TPA: peptidylprolyl isomerase [Lutibacter sp.]|nr:peptidylprolyl isomerase [Lutibacter sp.]
MIYTSLNPIKRITFFIFLVLITATISAQKRIKLDGVVAVVGKNVVLHSDIDKYKLELEQSGESVASLSSCQILEQMMEQKLLAHHAVVDSLVANEKSVLPNVDRKIDYFKQQLGSEEKVVALYGFDNIDDLKKELTRIEIESSLIGQMRQSITSKVEVTPEEVRNYFNSLETQNELPEFTTEVKLAQIVRNVEASEEEVEKVLTKLNKIKDEVEEGANMKMKALLYSDDPGVTQNGGLYSITRDSPFVKEFKDAAFSIDEGQVSEPFKSDFGYHIVKVEKVKGQTIDVRHVLIQPKISDNEKLMVKNKLDSISSEIKKGTLTFEEAVIKYSHDKKSSKNRGVILNPFSNESTFRLSGEQFMRAFPSLHGKIFNLNEGEMTEVFYDETREGEKMFKLVLVKEKMEGHKAEFAKDYVKIQNLALSKKRQEVVEEWVEEKIVDTYIKISEDYKNCEFKTNFKKNK